MLKSEVSTIATVSASLRMFDMMTRPLQQVTQSLNLTISAMDKMNNTANRDIGMTNTLNAAKASIQKACSGLQELASAQDKATNEQNKLNNSFNRGISSSEGLFAKVKGLVGAYLGFQATKEGLDLTIGGAMGLQQQLFTLQGILGNKDVATAYFDNLQKKGNDSVFAFEDFAANARKYMQFTKNTDSLDKLANLSERLTLMDPTQGLQGAGFALKEMMSGDGVSLKERFGFGKADIEILKASKDMGDFISKFDTLLNKKGFTEGMLEQYNKSAAAQFDNLKSNSRTALAQAGNDALETLAPTITRLNQAFSNGSFQSFFDGVSTGLVWIANLALGAADAFKHVGSTIANNWGAIVPIVLGIVAALIAYNAAVAILSITSTISNGIELAGAIAKAIHTGATLEDTSATAAQTAAQWGLNTAILTCPITWIIVGIIALIAIFYAAVAAVNHFAGTSVSATGLICGAFMAALAFIGNLFVMASNVVIDIISVMWNFIATFAEFFANVFNNPIASIIRLFAGMADTVLGILKSIADAIDAVFGFNLANAVSGWQSSLKGATSKLVGEAKIKVPRMDSNVMKLERFDYSKAYGSGYKFGKNVSGKFDLSKAFNGAKNKGSKQPKIPNMDAWNKAKGPGELSMAGDKNKKLKDANKHLKNIDDKMNISNEHLEMMRDLAEQKSIQNFVTLTPTVQVTTGDVKEEADINKIIAKIENYMETELVNSAEGVYA